MEFLWFALLLLALVVAWATNLVGLPGNWLMLAFAVLYWIFMPSGTYTSIGSTVLIVMAALATLGEFVGVRRRIGRRIGKPAATAAARSTQSLAPSSAASSV